MTDMYWATRWRDKFNEDINLLNTDTIGSLSNDDGNENGKKARNSEKQNNKFARASRSFVHFFAVAAWLQRESA